MWTKLYDSLSISELDGERLPKPSEQSLALFELTSGIRLPVSYREFTKVFGIGELAGYFRIAAPLEVKSEYNLDEYNKIAHGDPAEELWAIYAPSAIIEKMLFFGETIGGEMFAWDTTKVTDKENLSTPSLCSIGRGTLNRSARRFRRLFKIIA